MEDFKMANEQKKGIYELNLDSDVFLGLKTDFNKILRRTLSNMESKHSDEAEVTVKLKISTKNDMVPDFVSGNGMNREIVRPSFIHKVESVMKIQEKVSGHVSGDYEMVWDEDKCQFVMKTIDNGQVSMDDLEKEEDTKQEYAQLNPAKPQLEEGKEDAEDVIEGVYREINAEDEKDDGNAEDIQYDEPEN